MTVKKSGRVFSATACNIIFIKAQRLPAPTLIKVEGNVNTRVKVAKICYSITS